jgi:hypothetical protein
MGTFIIGTLIPYSMGHAQLSIAIRPFSNPGRLYLVSGEEKPGSDGFYRQIVCNKRAADGALLCVAITGEILEDEGQDPGQIRNANVLEYLGPLEAVKWHEQLSGKSVADYFPPKHVR